MIFYIRDWIWWIGAGNGGLEGKIVSWVFVKEGSWTLKL
jgi:hypothetical protein